MNVFAKSLCIGVGCLALFCCTHRGYLGDGSFEDKGWLAYSNRYTVDLGEIELKKDGSAVFQLAGLPHAEFTVGIDVKGAEDVGLTNQAPIETFLRIELRSSSNEIVILEEGPMSEWVATTSPSRPGWARFYRRGETEDVVYANGNTGSKRLGVKASEGWGTYFKSEKSESYVLKVAVLSSGKLRDVSARVTLVGWDR